MCNILAYLNLSWAIFKCFLRSHIELKSRPSASHFNMQSVWVSPGFQGTLGAGVARHSAGGGEVTIAGVTAAAVREEDVLVAKVEGDMIEGWVREEEGRDAAAMVEDMGVDVMGVVGSKEVLGRTAAAGLAWWSAARSRPLALSAGPR